MKRSKKRISFNTGINITPLLDVLTVLLFFLIKSMSVTSISLNTPDDIRLPASYVEAQAEEAVVLSLSENKLLVDQEVILELDQGRFPKAQIGSDQRTLLPLAAVLSKKYRQRLALYEGLDEVQLQNIPAPKLLIQADRDLSFGLMKYMLHTVAKVGYTDYQFIVVPKVAMASPRTER